MYRIRNEQIEVFLVHPGGPFFKKKNDGFWSIPKGRKEPGENILSAALREFKEEVNLTPPQTKLINLGTIKQKSGKIVHCWAFAGDLPENYVLKSKEFELKGPTKAKQKTQKAKNPQRFPEIDQADFFNIQTAKRKIIPAQKEFLERLEKQFHK